jgi:hypothetical protein
MNLLGAGGFARGGVAGYCYELQRSMLWPGGGDVGGELTGMAGTKYGRRQKYI